MIRIFENKAIGIDQNIHVVRGKIYDNHVMSGGVLTDDGILNFAKKIWNKPSEWMARIEGEPKHFAGIVYGDELDREIHIIADFDVPPHWTFYEGIDPHDGKATRWGFFAVSPDRFNLPESGRKVNRVHMVDFLEIDGMPVSGIVRQAKIKRASLGYERPQWVVLDAKYGIRSQQTGEKLTNWQIELQKADPGVPYILGDSSPGAIEIGHKIVKEYLTIKYHALLDKNVPTFCIFKRCDAGMGSPVQMMFTYAWDEEGKLREEYKDFPDVIRYVLMRFPRYKEKDKDYYKAKRYERYSGWAV